MREASPAAPQALPPDRLYRRTDPAALDFATTEEMAQLPGLIHQPRAREAIGFGTCIGQPGFNIFAVGDTAGRVREAIRLMLDEAALSQRGPPDWVYVYNFADPQRPRALSLPAGRAPGFQKAVHDLIAELKAALPAVFESEDYQKQRGAMEQAIQAKGQAAFAALNEKAQAKNIAILRTPAGFTLAPMRDGKIVPPADFNAWPRDEQLAIQQAIESLEKDLEDTLRGMPRLEKETRDAVQALERETARLAMEHPVEQAKADFADLPEILAHLETLTADLLQNVHLFTARQEAAADPVLAMRLDGALEKFEINVLISQSDHGLDAPVVEELNPTLANLVGRIEYMQMQGALVTNFRQIKAGALHRANGGTLLLDVRALLSEPYSWAALKRALTRREIVIEDVTRFIGMTTTVSLEPDPIPLNIKVVLFGDRSLYYMLSAADPDLARHFKVLADFDDSFERTVENEMMLARMIGAMAKQEGLKPLDREAVGRIIEHAARIAEDQTHLTLRVELIRDLVTEISHWAGVAHRTVATKDDVEHAIAKQIARASRIRDLGQSMIVRNIALIDTSGAQVGQVNGLSVMSLGGFAFGKPTRITCSVRPGAGRIVDIEREVELGGPLHSKGVLILSGYLASRYGQDTPISLNASLVFEQSYGGVDGDSASSTELYALLSAISELPLRQDIAVTGSVNQHGIVQAIGGANDKIEGYFDICVARGLTGTQGVMIPASNAQNLMLRADVTEACASGKFSIWPIETIGQGIELLTGHAMGERGVDGIYPEGTVNRAVVDRLERFARVVKEVGGKSEDGGKGDKT
ncbi:MAG: ATP-binding protein [Acetobacteraceae bacterium]|nr:ATP-binding protein [Acetobacteraceae bacterium]